MCVCVCVCVCVSCNYCWGGALIIIIIFEVVGEAGPVAKKGFLRGSTPFKKAP